MKILAVLFSLISATIAFAGVDGKSYDVTLESSVFRFSFRSGTAFITSGGYEWNFPYSEPEPIGSISGIPFYLDGERLTLILATATGTESTYQPTYKLSFVTSIQAYLWHGAVRGSDIFWGSYITQSGDDPRNPQLTDRTARWQRYYKMSPPYSSYVTYKLTDSGNHESCKPFFWDGSNQLVLTERGAVYAYGDNVNRTFVGDYRHYLLAVNTWNGVPWFAWNPATFAANNGNSGTQLWYWDGAKSVYSGVCIADIMTFHLLEHDGCLYLFGQHPDYDSGRIYRVNPDLSTECVFSGGVGLHHAISYSGTLYAGAGSRNGGTASIYRLEGGTFCMVETLPENINNFGTFAQYQGYLFASGVRSNGSAVVMRLTDSGWQTLFAESDFTRLKSTAGVSSGLIQPSGFMVTTDKLYIMLNSTEAGRSGPSHMFSIETE
jgi:hypothetical protein